MNKKCLYCYQPLKAGGDFHEACSLLFFGARKPPVLDFTLDEIAELAKEIAATSITVPGVQPKLSLGLMKSTLEGKNAGRLTIVGALGGNYILKPQNLNFPQMPENEHLTMLLAARVGIAVVPSTLVRLKSGELSYITRRIDRTKAGEKIHMLDMFQILEATDKYKSSLEKVGSAVLKYTTNTLFDALRLFEIILFCYLTGNSDMHLKNFSLIQSDEGWAFSPAYDLLNVQLHLPEDLEEVALTLNGKKSRLKKDDFLAYGRYLNLSDKQMNNAMTRITRQTEGLIHLIGESFLSEANRKKYQELLSERAALFL